MNLINAYALIAKPSGAGMRRLLFISPRWAIFPPAMRLICRWAVRGELFRSLTGTSILYSSICSISSDISLWVFTKARICFSRGDWGFSIIFATPFPKSPHGCFYVMDVEQVFTREFFLHVSHELQDLIIGAEKFLEGVIIFLSGHFSRIRSEQAPQLLSENFNRSNMSHYTDKKTLDSLIHIIILLNLNII